MGTLTYVMEFALSTGQTVFEGRKFHVEQRRFEANSVPQVYDVIVHLGAAVILPVLDDGRLVLIHN